MPEAPPLPRGENHWLGGSVDSELNYIRTSQTLLGAHLVDNLKAARTRGSDIEKRLHFLSHF